MEKAVKYPSRSEATRRQWADPAIRAVYLAALKRRSANPGWRKNQALARGWHSDEFIAKVRAIWDRGFTAGRIAGILNVSKNAISGIARRNGFAPRPSPIKRKNDAAVRT
jgi:hypothetical protein